MTDITQDELKELVVYFPATGDFYTKETGKKLELVAKSITNAYIVIYLKKKLYFAHRLAWLYTHGDWPNQIDHINGDGIDNRLCNIRNVSRLENSRNLRLPKNNTSGCIGVTWVKKARKWKAQVSINNKVTYIGEYIEWWDAVCARMSANNRLGFHPNHGSIRK